MNHTAPRQRPANKVTRLLQVGGSCAVTGVLLYAVFRQQTPAELLTTAGNIDRGLLLAYVSLSLLGLLVRAVRYGIALRVASPNPPRLSALLVITGVRNALVDLLPARLGELSVLYILHRYGISLSAGAAVSAVCLVFDVAALLLLSLLFIFFGSGVGIESGTTLLLPLFAGGFGLVLVLLHFLGPLCRFTAAVLRSRLPAGLRARPLITKGVALLDELSRELVALSSFTASLLLLLASVMLRALKYGSLYLLFLAVVAQWGVGFWDISPLTTTLAFLAAEASASLPISGLMGFGAYEGAWSLVFSGAESRIPSVPSVIFLIHLITQVVSYIIGLLAGAAFLTKELRLAAGENPEKRV